MVVIEEGRYLITSLMNGTAQDYQISVIKTALSKHPSALVGLSSTSVEEQLKRVATFDKSSPGFMDEFFRP